MTAGDQGPAGAVIHAVGLEPGPVLSGAVFIHLAHHDAAAGLVLVQGRSAVALQVLQLHGPRDPLIVDGVVGIEKLIGKPVTLCAVAAVFEEYNHYNSQYNNQKSAGEHPFAPLPLQVRCSWHPVDDLRHTGVQRGGDALQSLHVRQAVSQAETACRVTNSLSASCSWVICLVVRSRLMCVPTDAMERSLS